MNELTVFTRATSDPALFEVSFANGVQKQGILRIQVPHAVSRPDVAAELGALHHLLVVREIFGNDRAGNNLRLTVSRGQIRKLMEGRSGMPDLIPWAGALSIQFAGATIKVEGRSAAWEKPRRLEHVTEFVLPDRLDTTYNVPGFGVTRLTNHALEQFCSRSNQIEKHEGWRQIRYMLGPALQRVVRDAKVDALARERYGNTAVILYAPATHWNFVIVLANEVAPLPSIVTMYLDRRKPWDLGPLESAPVPAVA